MDEMMYRFFDDQPISRFIYYNRKVEELYRAKEMRTFLDEARRSGLKLTLGAAVDAWMCPVEIQLQSEPGREMTEYLVTWMAGMCHRIQADIDELLIAWPSLRDFLEDADGRVGEIGAPWAPQGP
jgi:hypothetical protein